MSFCIDDEKLLEKYKAIWNKIKDFKKIKVKPLPAYGDRYIKTKFRGLNVPEDVIECESFTVISFDSLLVYHKRYYLQVCLENCAYKSKGTDYAKSKNSKEYMICHYFFFNYGFEFQDYVCNECHDVVLV